MRENLQNDVQLYIHTCTYKHRGGHRLTSVGLAHARPKYVSETSTDLMLVS